MERLEQIKKLRDNLEQSASQTLPRTQSKGFYLGQISALTDYTIPNLQDLQDAIGALCQLLLKNNIAPIEIKNTIIHLAITDDDIAYLNTLLGLEGE